MVKLEGLGQAFFIFIIIICLIVGGSGYMLGGDDYYDNKETCEAQLKRTEHCISVYIKE